MPDPCTQVELPKVVDVAFVPPVIKDASSDADEATKREAVREEQRKRAAEAEERKRRRAETADRKRVAASEAAKRLEAERKERDRSGAGPPGKAAQAHAATAAVQQLQGADSAGAEEAAAVATGSGTDTGGVQRHTAWEKRQRVAAAKRPKVSTAQGYWRMVVKLINNPQYQKYIVLGVLGFVLLLLLVGYWAFA
jgi:hypothetical protein